MTELILDLIIGFLGRGKDQNHANNYFSQDISGKYILISLCNGDNDPSRHRIKIKSTYTFKVLEEWWGYVCLESSSFSWH